MIQYRIKKMDIISASKEGYFNIVEQLIREGVNINIKNEEDGYTPLHYALFYKYYDVAELLIENGSDVNSLSKNLLTPLHFATSFNSLDMVKILCKKGANLNIISGNNEKILLGNNNKTPLELAVLSKNLNMIKCLIGRGADINLNMNHTPIIMYGYASGDIEIIKYLYKMNAEYTKNYNLNNFILFAIHSGNIESVKYIFKLYPNINLNNVCDDGTVLIKRAIKLKNIEIIKFLIDNGADKPEIKNSYNDKIKEILLTY